MEEISLLMEPQREITFHLFCFSGISLPKIQKYKENPKVKVEMFCGFHQVIKKSISSNTKQAFSLSKWNVGEKKRNQSS